LIFNDKIKSISRDLKADLHFYRLVIRDPRTPKLPKLLLGIAIFYVLIPFDIIPDFIPVMGYLDDVVIVGLLAMIAIKFIPAEVWKEYIKMKVCV
jgi:uncharacterized membrane protein YkvA (DUF1232 family)